MKFLQMEFQAASTLLLVDNGLGDIVFNVNVLLRIELYSKTGFVGHGTILKLKDYLERN